MVVPAAGTGSGILGGRKEGRTLAPYSVYKNEGNKLKETKEEEEIKHCKERILKN